jgi:hypothetical protein
MSVSGLAIRSPWTEISEGAVSALHANPGVYEIADASGQTLLIGYAGGKSLFGLRGEVAKHIGDPRAALFRVEQNMQYISRWKELLMVFRSETGALPVLNPAEDGFRLGHLGPRNWSSNGD